MSDITRTVHELDGADGRPLQLVEYRQPRPTGHLGVLFPGRAYGCDKPLFHYSRKILQEAGADVTEVRYDYEDLLVVERTPQVLERVRARLHRDVRTALAAALAARPGRERLTLVGKRLGTRAVAHIAEHRAELLGDLPLKVFGMTPLIGDQTVLDRLCRLDAPALYVIGSHDEHYSREAAARMHELKHSRLLVLEGADHGLELPSDLKGTLESLLVVMSAFYELVYEGKRP